MKTAIIIRYTESQTFVQCPYCNKQHAHGNGGSKTAEGQSRMAHCNKGGEYVIRFTPVKEDKSDYVVSFN